MTASKTITTEGTTASDANRQRRAHKKSRRGCSSCKLRRVKCDERRPACHKCRDFGVACSYDGKISALSFAGESSFSLNDLSTPNEQVPSSAKANTRDGSLGVARTHELSLSRSRRLGESTTVLAQFTGLPSPPDSDGENSNYAFGRSELEIFQRFNERTVLSVGSSQTASTYQREIFQLACSHPFLEHIVIALTLLHDRHLAGTDAITHKTLSHWYHGTAKFKEVLMQPVEDESRDALWASAALMGTIQFATFEARTPEEAWPLKSCDTTDLDWLKMSDGKKAVFAIADPTRADSVFCKMSTGHGKLWRSLIGPEDCSNTDAVEMTRDFVDMFGLGPSSTSCGDNNPYYKAAMALARLLHVKCDRNNVVEFFGFIVNINPELKRLLDQRDARALLLVVHWYAKLYRAQWWLHRRGMIEGRAICMYLDKYHGNDAKLQRLLQWPKAELGLETSPVDGGALSGWSSEAATVLCVM